jgi:urease accessory protein
VNDLALLRLLQICDSAFPVGGFAYSHGLEWLTHEGIVRDEASLAALLDTYVDQCAGRHWMPAALAAHEATTSRMLERIDRRFDLSFASPVERDASRSMGWRLRTEASNAFGFEDKGDERPAEHFAVVFGDCARRCGVTAGPALHGLGFTMVQSVVQAAVRLGFVGQSAATRLAANGGDGIASAARRTMESPRRLRFGAFSPGIDVAATLQPTLNFRMFAS